MAMFLTHLVEAHDKSPGRALALGSALTAFFNVQGVDSPATSPRTKLRRAALRRLLSAPQQAKAFSVNIWYALVLREIRSGRADGMHVAAAFILMFAGLFRGSEVCVPRISDLLLWIQKRGLRNSDLVFFTASNGALCVTVTIRYRKNDQLGRGHSVTIRGPGIGETRPDLVRVLQTVHNAALPNALMLIEVAPRAGRRPMLTATLTIRLKEGMQALGFGSSGYSSHSFRASGTSALAKAGYSAETIMTWGGWRSYVVLLYIRSLVVAARDTMADIWNDTFTMNDVP